jgi:hypothetical protein
MVMETQEKTLLTEKEQARLLSMSWRGLQEFRKRGLVPCIRIGRLVRYSPKDVERALQKLKTK